MTATLSKREFIELIFEIAGEPVKHFKPFAFYNKAGDCIEFFVTQDDYFAERVDDYLTLYLEMNTEQIVGFVVKNVRRIIERLSKQKSAMEFIIDDDKAKLRCLFAAMFANGRPDLEEKRALVVREYRKVVEIAESNELDEIELSCI